VRADVQETNTEAAIQAIRDRLERVQPVAEPRPRWYKDRPLPRAEVGPATTTC
jgi:hypothetical protein